MNDLLQFTADREPQRSHCLLRKLLVDIKQTLRPQCRSQGIRVHIDVPKTDTLWADESMVRRAVLNLFLNALDAMPEGGEIVITSCQSANGYELEFADSGPGVSEESLRKIFEPFYSTKQGGTGLGLAIVGRILEAHGGDVMASNCPEGGAAFTLRFPEQRMEAAA